MQVSQNCIVLLVCRPTAQDFCVLGVFVLQVQAIFGLTLAAALGREELQALMKRSVEDMVPVLSRYLPQQQTTLQSEFGAERGADTLPKVAMQLLGRLLHSLADLPTQEQFSFGKNWKQFIEKGRLSAAGLLSSVRELRRCAGGFGFEKLKVLDLGCGSGLSSLAFRLLGAESVLSADLQPASLEAARQLRQLFDGDGGGEWRLLPLSVLDARSLAGLGEVDVVYSWGVLHHTGDVWQALHNAQLPLADDGLLLAAVYAEEFYDEQDHILLMKQFYQNATARQQQDLEIAIGTGICHSHVPSWLDSSNSR